MASAQTTPSDPATQERKLFSPPGGNLTGFSYLPPTLGGKWLDLLKEIAPLVTRVAFVVNLPSSPYGGLFYGSIQLANAKFSAQTMLAQVQEPAEFEQIMARLGGEPGGGMIIDPDAFTSIHRKLIVELAARYRLPAFYPRRFFATDGGGLRHGHGGHEGYASPPTQRRFDCCAASSFLAASPEWAQAVRKPDLIWS